MYRDEKGYTKAEQASGIRGVKEFIEEGAELGYLWMQGHFGVGDPLAPKPFSPPAKAKTAYRKTERP